MLLCHNPQETYYLGLQHLFGMSSLTQSYAILSHHHQTQARKLRNKKALFLSNQSNFSLQDSQ